MSTEPLLCPSCATPHPFEERFCRECNMPLVYSGAEAARGAPVGEQRERARKIKPQLAEGELVRVVGARNQTEAEFVQGMLLEEGVPSLVKRSLGFDVPDFLAAGPRDVLVPASGAATAREVLLQAELISSDPGPRLPHSPARVLVGLLVAVAVVALIAWLGTSVL